MGKPSSSKVMLAALATTGMLNCAPALAQETGSSAHTDAGGIADIIVTAQKRAEPLQTVPIAISAVNEAIMERRGFDNIGDLTMVTPNTNLALSLQNPTQIAPHIRGIGTYNSDPLASTPIAISVDGVYLQTVFSGMVDTFDVEQVEILRGPQGTLQGRNATGGAVNIRTRRPSDQFGARFSVEYGRYAKFQAKAAIEGPLVPEKLAAKVSLLRYSGGNYAENLTGGRDSGGRDTWSGRAGLLFTPSSALTVYATADFTRDRSPQAASRAANTDTAVVRPEDPQGTIPLACSMLGYCTTDKPGTNRKDFTHHTRADSYGFSLNADLDVGPATLTSVGGYRKTKDYTIQDYDALPIPIFEIGRQTPNPFTVKELSQELRLASNDDGGADLDGKLKWVVGAYYARMELTRLQLTELFGSVGAASQVSQKLDSYAVFGHIDFKPIDALTIYVGGRKTWDKKNYTLEQPLPVRNLKRNFDNFSKEAGASFRITQDHMIYVRYSTGYIAGGFSRTGDSYDSETVESLEAGFKTSWANRKLQLNGAVFKYSYDDLQRIAGRLLDVPPFFTTTPVNVGKATIQGVELELQAQPIRGLQIMGAVGYLDAHYDRYDVLVRDPDGTVRMADNSNLRVDNAPKWTASGSIMYDIPLDGADGDSGGMLTPSFSFSHRSAHTTAVEDLPFMAQKGYVLLDAALRYQAPGERYSLTLFADNLTNKHYIVGSSRVGGVAQFVIDAPGRTYGVRATARF